MSWFSEIAGKAESLLNKIDQKTANVLNSSSDMLVNKINDENEFIIHSSNESVPNLQNSQSLPQLKSIFVSNGNTSDSNFKYGHSRDSSSTSYNGLLMNDTPSNTLISKNTYSSLTKKPIDDGQLFDYLNTKKDDSKLTLTNYLTIDNRKSNGSSNDSSISTSNETLTVNRSSFQTQIDQNNQSSNANKLSCSTEDFVSNGYRKTTSKTTKGAIKKNETIRNNVKKENNEFNEIDHKQENTSNAISKVESDKSRVISDLETKLENLLTQSKIERTNKEKFEREIAILNTSYSKLKCEFEDYKIKAQRTLQLRDQEIEKLQHNESQISDTFSSIDRQQLEEDRENLHKLNRQLQEELQEIRSKYLKSKQQSERYTNERIADLETQCLQQQQKLNDFESSMLQLKAQNEQLIIEKNQSDSILFEQYEQEHLNAKQREIDALKTELVELKKNSKWSQHEIPQDLELKIKNLTENLLNKQTLVEHLKREKNTLILQLEDSKRQMSNLQNKNSNYCINFKEGFSNRNDHASNSFDNTSSTPVGRRVRRAYSQLDQLSHHIRYFIRAYPSAQKIFLGYIVSLHFLIFFILFNSKPEV